MRLKLNIGNCNKTLHTFHQKETNTCMYSVWTKLYLIICLILVSVFCACPLKATWNDFDTSHIHPEFRKEATFTQTSVYLLDSQAEEQFDPGEEEIFMFDEAAIGSAVHRENFSMDKMPESLEKEMGLYDPIEGFNRSMGAVNYVGFIYVLRPVTTIWATVMPRFMINGFDGICTNIEFPVRGGSLLLQGRFADAGDESLRFLANTILGIAGFFDVADPWFGLKEHDEDFGQAFASWGIGHGFYIVLPLEGPTSLRDGFGLIFDYGLDPKSYIYGAQYFTRLNRATIYFEAFEQVTDTYRDPYVVVRNLWYIMRKIKIRE